MPKSLLILILSLNFEPRLDKNLQWNVLVEVCGVEPDSTDMYLDIFRERIVGVSRGNLNRKFGGMKSFRRQALML